MMSRIGMALYWVWFSLSASLPSSALADPAQLCRDAAARVAQTSGVPYAVLLAITQTETGRLQDGQTQPWAWAINMGGTGHWLSSRVEAYNVARAALDRGQRNFDVGCFQINYRWHHMHFASLEAMFDPILNGEYAARFLTELYQETGSWSRAAGTYHSRTEVHASRYRARFDQFYAAARGSEPAPVLATPRPNAFTLLQPGTGSGGLGSLVPLRKGGGR